MEMPIGFIDSGVGGASILQACLNEIPNENYVFYVDCLNAPYGNKSKKFLQKEILHNVTFLVEKRNIKLLVVACNTATAVAKESILEKYPFLPCVFIEPPIKVAIDLGYKNILVLATKRTIKDNKLIKYYKHLSKHNDFKIKTLFIKDLASYIDNKNKKIKELIKHNIKYFDYDAIVLGCTHYNFIKSDLKELYPNCEIISCEKSVAKRVRFLLKDKKILLKRNQKGSVELILNADNSNVKKQLKKMFSTRATTKKQI